MITNNQFNKLPEELHGLIGSFIPRPIAYLNSSKQLQKPKIVQETLRRRINPLLRQALKYHSYDLEKINFLRHALGHVTVLNFENGPQCSDDQLSTIVLACSKLRVIRLKDHKIGPSSMAALASRLELKEIRYPCLHSQSDFVHKIVKHPILLSRLQSFTCNAGSCPLTIKAIGTYLEAAKQPKKLTIAYTAEGYGKIRDDLITKIAQSAVQELGIDSSELTSQNLSSLTQMKDLRKLTLQGCFRARYDAYTQIGKMTKLQSLKLDYCLPANDAFVQQLLPLTTLKTLHITTTVTALKHIATQFPQLQELSLYLTEDGTLSKITTTLDKKTLRFLADNLTSLRVFTIINASLENGFQAIEQMKALERLEFQKCKIKLDVPKTLGPIIQKPPKLLRTIRVSPNLNSFDLEPFPKKNGLWDIKSDFNTTTFTRSPKLLKVS